MLKDRSLKTRLAIAVIILVVAVALLVTYALSWMMMQRLRSLVTAQQTVLVATTAREVEQKIAVRLAALQALASDIAADSRSSGGQTGAVAWTQGDTPQRFLAHHAGARTLFDNLALFSDAGDALANLNSPTSRGAANIATRKYFTETLHLRGPVISQPTASVFSKQPLVILTAPVLDATGKASMVLTGSIALKNDNFTAQLARTRIGRTGYFYILAEDGTVVADRDSSRILTRDSGARPTAERRALDGFEGTVEDVDRTGVRGLFSVKRIQPANWVLIAFYPEDEAFSAFSEVPKDALLLAIFMVAVIGPLAWLFLRQQLKPLDALQQRIRAIRNRPTLAMEPQSYSTDEIGVLARDFDELMRDRLFAEVRYQTGAEELRAATNSGLDAFFIFQAERDATGQVTDFTLRYVNAIAEKMLGKPLAELSNWKLQRGRSAHPLAMMFDRFIAVMHTGDALQEELCVTTDSDGRTGDAGSGSEPPGIRWFQHQIVPQADGVALTLRDITDRKRDEIDVRNNRAFLQSLTDHLPLLFYAKRMRPDGQGEFVAWNQAAEAITGRTSADMLGRTDRQIHSSTIAQVYEAHDRAILADPVPLDIAETRFYRPDGTLRYLHVISVPILGQNGQVEYIIGIGEDITERRQQDHILRTSQAELKAVNDSSPLGLFMTDLAGNCTYVNKTYESMSGVTATDIVGDAWFRSLHPDDQESAIEGWVAAIQHRKPYQSAHRFLHPDGQVLHGSFKAVPITVDEQITGYVGSVDDISARLEAERGMRASEQKLRLVIDNIPALIGYLRADRRFAFGNRKYQDAYGLAAANMQDMSAVDVLGPDVYAQSEMYIDAALHGAPAHFERLVTHAGQLRWERVSYVPDVDENNAVRGFFSLVEDITELKQAQHTFAKSEMRLRMIADNLPALIAYIDSDCRYRFCNAYYETVLGIKPERILGRTLTDVLGEQAYQAVAKETTAVLSGQRMNFERHDMSGDVDRHFLHDYIPDIGRDGSVVGFYSMVLDITARKTAELKQAAGEKLLRGLTDNLPALVSFIDHDERFQFNNRMYTEWLDRPLSEITGRTMREVHGEMNYQRYKPYFDQALKGSKVEFEFEATRKSEPHFFRAAYAPQFDPDGKTSGVCSMISDITALKKVEHQLRILARFDSLTGLPNRNQFEEKLAEAMARSSRNGRAMAVMFLDIDHFKEINDTIGHHGGDAVLREFAQRLQHCVRKTDTVSRLAGDEFTIILEGLQVDRETAVVANKIIDAMRDPFVVGAASRSVTTSIGIAVRRQDESSADALLRRADEALYIAKAAGRNTFEHMV